MFKRKDKQQEQKQIEDNGKALIDKLNDPDFKKAMLKATSDSDTGELDLTKNLLLREALHDRENIDYYTYWKDKQETEQVNRLQSWYRLFPLVFGNSDTVKICQEIVKQHVKDAQVNRSSMPKNSHLSALVYAIKQDSVVQTEKQIASFLRR